MELKNPLYVVRDLKQSIAFYQDVLGLEVIADFGANVTLTGGLALQTLESWAGFLGKDAEAIRFGGNDAEVYFETDDFDAFLKTLRMFPEVKQVAPPLEHRWGQRVVRIYDPDRHIVEVGESIAKVCKRFIESGLSEEGVARRMDVPLDSVRRWLK